MQKWHYQLNGHAIGPVALEEIETLIRLGRINGRTMVWHDALPDWLPLEQSDLAAKLQIPQCAEQVAWEIAGFNRLNHAFKLLAVLATATTLVGWVFLAVLLNKYHVEADLSSGWLAAVISVNSAALGVWLAAYVVWCVVLFKSWRLVPPECADTTPGRAVGLQFIPIFNWYWNFVAVGALAKSLNAQIQREEVATPLVNERLMQSFAILRALEIFVLPGFAALVIGCLIPGELHRAAVAIWQNRLRHQI